MGPKFCGEGCISSCGEKSECNPGWGMQWSNASTCPLNVCCSDYGFCGTTELFCNGKTVASPQCPGGTSADQKLIGYYEGWNLARPCGTMKPEDIPLGWYTHINFAFALVNPTTFRIDPMDANTASLYKRVTALKEKQTDLKVWIAIGGWAMNDPGPYRTTFSDLAASESKREQPAFLLQTQLGSDDCQNGFDGVDLDWEYPVADDRGGVPADFDHYPNFLKRLRDRLNASGKEYGLSITLPASYWYLRGFDLQKMEPHLDWFNIMTYDIRMYRLPSIFHLQQSHVCVQTLLTQPRARIDGVWDSTVHSIGPYAYAHTNLTEIQLGLELLWRNNINPGRVVMGLGFYGRSFTMKDPACMHAGCEFSDGAHGGECTGTPGVLSAAEIVKIIDGGAAVAFDEAAAVKIVTWDGDQWVSWDDAETLKIKLDYANQRCLGGTMVWAIDLDDGTLLNALGGVSSKSKKRILKDIPDPLPDFESPWPKDEKDEL
ncbi:chitinase [Apiospora phragmitis]|uniref:chitinase n=1 Tax=Apiospora phragmitis TaxID=2905665 RepID=A0ABR1TSF8_9PEZI